MLKVMTCVLVLGLVVIQSKPFDYELLNLCNTVEIYFSYVSDEDGMLKTMNFWYFSKFRELGQMPK